MSGPKVDTAALCEQDRQRLMRARQQRMELVHSISLMMEQIEASFVPAESDSEEIAAFSAAVQQRQAEYCALLRTEMERVRKGNEHTDCLALGQKCETLFASFKEKTAADLAAIALGRKQETVAVAAVTVEKLSAIPLAARGRGDRQKSREMLLEKMGQFLSDESNGGKYKNAVLGLQESLLHEQETDERKEEKRLATLWDDFTMIETMAHEAQAALRETYALYCNECFDSTQAPLPITAFSSEEEVKKAIDALRLRAEQKISKEYIKRQIDDVMAKHGYDILRSELLEETRDDQILYGVNDHTAIHVFVSDEQQVAMRVVGIGFDEAITDEEDEQLYEQQCAFCSLHPQITQELAMRGVMLTTKKHLAPDRKYNKKIKVAATSGESRAKREMKRAAPKVLHRE